MLKLLIGKKQIICASTTDGEGKTKFWLIMFMYSAGIMLPHLTG